MIGLYRVLAACLLAFGLGISSGSVFSQSTLPGDLTKVLDEIKQKASLKLAPTTEQSAIAAANQEFKRLSSVSVAASIDERAATILIAQQLKADAKFSNPRFTFAKQAVDGTIRYSGTVSLPVAGPVDLTADLHARVATAVKVDTTKERAEFQIGFAVTALEVTHLAVAKGGKPLPAPLTGLAELVIAQVLVPAQTLINHIELRVPTIVNTKIELEAAQTKGVTTAFTPKSLPLTLKVAGFSHLVDSGRIILVFQEGGTLGAPVKDPETSFDTFRSEFLKKFPADAAYWIRQGQLSAYVEAAFLNSLSSRLLAAGPICMNAKASDLPAPFNTKVKLPPLEALDCTPTKDCTSTKECEQKRECGQNADCRACLLRSPFGNCIQSGNDPICEARKVAAKGSCEVEKSRRKAQCEADKVANKGACEAAKSAAKGVCEGFKEAYKRIRALGTDYANVESKDLLINGDGQACIRNITFEPESFSLQGKFDVAINSRASGHIKFTPLNVGGHLTCFAPVEKNLVLSASVPRQTLDITTSAKLYNDGTRVVLDVKIANPLHVRFPAGLLASKLATDPAFTIVCPVPGIAATVRTITPDAWWPKEARGDIERDLPDFVFALDLLRAPLSAGNLQVTGKMASSKVGVGGVFYFAKGL